MTQPFASSRTSLIALGIAFILTCVGVVVVALAAATGTFADESAVRANVTSVGSQLRPGTRVKYRGVSVGRVEEILQPGTAASRTSTVALSIDDHRLVTIPAAVTARIVPSTLFGESQVELVAPKDTTGPTLRAGAVVPADVSSQTAELAKTMDSLQRIATALQPAKLQVVLGTLSRALDSRGPQLGSMITRLDAELGLVLTQLPTVHDDVVALRNFIRSLSTATPHLLAAVKDVVTASEMVLERREKISSLISDSGTLADRVEHLVRATASDMICTIRVTAGLLGLLKAEQSTLGEGLANGIKANLTFIEVLSKGPWAAIEVTADDTFLGAVPPPKYTRADRPVYPGSAGPKCGGLAR